MIISPSPYSNTRTSLFAISQPPPHATISLEAPMRDRSTVRRDILHGDCFYTGLCDAIEEIIREPSGFIRDAETLARS